MPKTRASFRIAEDAQPLGKRPRRSSKTSGVLKELENVPKPRRSKELKKEPRVKCKEPENAPRSRSKRATSEDEAPKRRKLPKRKGRGVPPLRLQEEIMGDDEEDEEDDNVAPSNVKKAPRRRSSARIQKQITDKPTEPEKYDRPDDKDKNRPKSQAKRRNDSKRNVPRRPCRVRRSSSSDKDSCSWTGRATVPRRGFQPESQEAALLPPPPRKRNSSTRWPPRTRKTSSASKGTSRMTLSVASQWP